MTSSPNVMPAMREWWEANRPKPDPEIARRRAAEIRRDSHPVYTPATPEELEAIKAIGGVTFCPGIPTKRFARQIQGSTELTDAQRKYLWGIVWRFRRQIADKGLVERGKEITKRNEAL